jgi:hypothetical protein
MSFAVLKEEQRLAIPHYLKVGIDPCFGLSESTLVSQRPRMSPRGYWFLDFHNRFTISSYRNAILIPDTPKRDGQPLVWIRMIAKNSMEMNSVFLMPEILAFAIGLSSFMSRVP